jgi:predicted MFS family arabinose efflux permease
MAIAFVAILIMLPREPKGVVREKTRFTAPLRALGNRTLLVLAVAALFYNVGFFTLLAFSPFAPGLNGFTAFDLGLVFFGWGVAVAVTSVWVAPILTARMPRSTVLAVVLPLLAIDLGLVGLLVGSAVGIIVCIIVGGLFLGVLNTVLTEAVMNATDLPRSVASSAYSFVRFIGGAAAPPLAAAIAAWTGDPAISFYVGGASVLVAMVLIVAGRRRLRRIDGVEETVREEAEDIGVADAA